MSVMDAGSSRPWARFPARLVAARLAAGMTQLGLAKACGRSGNGWVANFESGINALPRHLDEIYVLATALAVPPEWLLFGRMFDMPGAAVAIGLGGPPEAVDDRQRPVDLVIYGGAPLGKGHVVWATCSLDTATDEEQLYLLDVRGRAVVQLGVLDSRDGLLRDSAGRQIRSRVVGTCEISPARPTNPPHRGR